MPIYKKFDKKFFKIWSPDMAYVLGFLFADGNIIRTKRGTHYISMYTNDKLLLDLIRQKMRSEHKISKSLSEKGCCYKIQIGSKELFNDLLTLGLIVNKSKRMKLPNIPKKFRGDFIRGYFDGDGNVWAGKIHKKRNKPTRIISSCFTSASTPFLRSLLLVLRAMGVNGGSVFKSKKGNYGRLVLSTLDSLKLYEIMYNRKRKLFLIRKKLIFESFIKMRA